MYLESALFNHAKLYTRVFSLLNESMYFSCAIMLGQIVLISDGIGFDPVGHFNSTPLMVLSVFIKSFCDINVHLSLKV